MSEHYGHVAGQRFYGCGECWGGDPNADVPDKRLTDAELAAEYWAAKFDVYLFAANGPRSRTAFYEACILKRFATHEHYDEERA